ncbi:M20/M25/M40 family metallo-hydrolase [Streptomyces roseicoloratus]|uniref:M20/M25/M40 family metallo-hydrolase n=1 Tax=Streptomyces roseicoloratus TaxID=2508722 RepID=A0ABY9RQG4_9ACTN|nr:M20/M25/M40 family metallo-hydrolase [Streptomyces roseicoloratus]WMX43988.1 M20/M25/M40 family metallo-hydrolase [Streptomyces roseicoloratus]
MNWAFTSSGHVTETWAVGLLRGMLEIPSSSYQERALADHLAEAMADLGFRAHIDTVGNVIGVIERGDGPTLMLLGHLDTVPGQVPVRSEDGRLYGRGAVDAKGPLAAMICAAASAADFPGRIVVIGVVEEETPKSRGAMAIRATHDRPDALIVGEPSGWSSVVIGYKGKLDLRYTVTCPATHPSNPEPKASELAVESWNALLDLLGPDAGHDAFAKPGATLVQVNADLTSATVDLSVRTPPGFDTEGLVTGLRERLPAGRLEVLNAVEACRADRSNPAVRALVSGIRKVHAQPRLVVKTATSDMNTLAEVWDIPMATYGPGDSRLDHADTEHIVLSDFLRGIDVLSHAISELSDLPVRTDEQVTGAPLSEGSLR